MEHPITPDDIEDYAPRQPNARELHDLFDYLVEEDNLDETTARSYIVSAVPLVIEGYSEGTPGYTGKVLVVLWSSLTAAEVFGWRTEDEFFCVDLDQGSDA
jgi:hypothetical protein